MSASSANESAWRIEPVGERGAGPDPPGGHRPGGGAGHLGVDVAVVVVVDRGGAAGRQRAAEAGQQHERRATGRRRRTSSSPS